MLWSCWAGLAVLWWGRRVEAWEQIAWSEDTLGHTGRNSSPSGRTFVNGGTASPGDKRAGRCKLPVLFTSIGTYTPAETANIGASFLLCFTINSKLLCLQATAFLGQKSLATAWQDPPPKDQYGSIPGLIPKVWGFETQPLCLR